MSIDDLTEQIIGLLMNFDVCLMKDDIRRLVRRLEE